MRRTLLTIASAAVIFGGLTGTAPASPPANAPASCVAVITSFEATQLPPGSVGREVSGLATGAPGLGRAIVSPLARCRGAEE